MRHTAGSWHHGSSKTLNMSEQRSPRVVGSGAVVELRSSSVDRNWHRLVAPAYSTKTERRFTSDRDPVQNFHDHERAIPAHCARTLPKPHLIVGLEVAEGTESAAPKC
jgi:hypothetical protein